MSTDTTKPKRDKQPATTVGTLSRIAKLLAAHSAAEQAQILAFLTAGK